MIGAVLGGLAGWWLGDKAGKGALSLVRTLEDWAATEHGARWLPDPWGEAPLRWYDGKAWTRHVKKES